MIHRYWELDELEGFSTIAWDFDETLIDNIRGWDFLNYIITHPHQKHFIVTHRSHGWDKHIPRELVEFHGKRASNVVFEAVHAVPDVLWESQNQSPGGIITDITPFLDWKGEMCKEIGAEALIDDNITLCSPGCIKHSIEFFFSYGFVVGE